MRLITILFVLCTISLVNASDRKARGRAAWAWASTPVSNYSPPAAAYSPTEPKYATSGATDALAEVNSERTKRGLPPFKHDPLLTQAAQEAARQRASRGIEGHLASDFDCLPAGAHADAAGCGALDDSWGWGTCCTYDSYTHAGAAWVRGADGKRYMHLFVRNEQTMQPATRSTETVTESSGTCTSGSCSTGSWQPGGIITRGRRGR